MQQASSGIRVRALFSNKSIQSNLCLLKGRLSLMCIALSAPVIAGSWQNSVALSGFTSVNVYTPSGYSPIGPPNQRSLLLLLHGCTQTINAYNTANLEQAAEEYGMVIAVPDAQHKEGFSCWAYWNNSNSGAPARNKLDYENLIQLAEDLTNDTVKAIDANQVYIAGLSSGAAFANTTACLAPDIFAGMGISAGPSIGTSSSGALGSCESADVANRCMAYAGSYASYLTTQIASVAQADDDSTVSTCYNTQNANGLAGVYGVNQLPGSNSLGGGNNTATETLWQDGRVSMVWFHGGVGHAWSGGAGASGSYINGNSINYASYLAEFFSTNNLRVDRNTAPIIQNLSVTVIGDQIQVSATIIDAETTVASATAVVTDAFSGVGYGNFNLTGSNDLYGGMSGSLADGLYQVAVTAVDDMASTSTASSVNVRVGPEPPAQGPELSQLVAEINAQCATVSGKVVDANLNLQQVEVQFTNGNIVATVSGDLFNAEACNLPGGANSATVIATDTTQLSSSVVLDFSIDAGQTATLDEHISAGRLDYSNYANCYLEYSATAFRLDETVVNASDARCRWLDSDASCQGPEINCSTMDPGGDDSGGDGDDGGNNDVCEQYSDMNYAHKAYYGRAYSSGSYFSPDYYAVGSDQAMPGSTYGITTLYSTDGGAQWFVGDCP